MIAQLATARSRLQRIQAVIDQKALKAPFSGTIGIPRINPGQYLQPGTVVATFQNLQSMKVDFTVPEQMIARVKAGPAHPHRRQRRPAHPSWAGSPASTRASTRRPASSSVQAVVDDNRDEAIVPGQFLRVRVELPPEPNIVTVPQTAVIASLYGDYVFALEEEKQGEQDQARGQAGLRQGRPPRGRDLGDHVGRSGRGRRWSRRARTS